MHTVCMNNVKVSVSKALKPRDTNLNQIYVDIHTNIVLWRYGVGHILTRLQFTLAHVLFSSYVYTLSYYYFVLPMRVRAHETRVHYTTPIYCAHVRC